ncbi:MAG: sulfatase family protein [Agriterribacter sp.]
MKKLLPVIIGFFLLTVCAVHTHAQHSAQRPNIVFIFSDDHAYQAISAYGSKLATTPNIDRIAKEGALFKNTFITNSICGPSRACLLTGKYSHINGYKFNERTFDENQQIFPELLQQAGYQTAWIGKLHLKPVPKGFDYWNVLPGQGHYYNPDFIKMGYDTSRFTGYVTDLITDFSLDWINNRDQSKPFFLVIGQKATHREWLPALEDLGAYDSVDFPLPPTFYDDYKGRLAAEKQDMTIDKTMTLAMDLKVHADYAKARDYSRLNPEQKKIFYDYYENKISKEFDEKKLSGDALVRWKYQRYLKDYLSTAKSLDRNIGRVLDYLDKNGLSENTIVIYASDQGFYTGEHGWFDKRFIYEESLRTPFVMRYPGVIKPGTTINQFALGIDWAPTFLDIAKANIPGAIQGKSLLPLLKAGNKAVPSWRKEMYYHYYEFPQPHHVYPHFGIRTERYKLVRFYGGIDSWELFDLTKDPNELNNIYNDKKNSALVTTLKASLKKLIVEYKDDEALKLMEN